MNTTIFAIVSAFVSFIIVFRQEIAAFITEKSSRIAQSLPILAHRIADRTATKFPWKAIRSRRRSASLVSLPPGWNLRRFSEVCFSEKTFTQVLEPSLSDMQMEHFEALAAGRLWKARMVLVRGYWSFWSAVLAQLPISLIRRVYEVWKATKIGS